MAHIILIFGDGSTKIQPIYVDDLVDCILSIIDEEIFLNETFDMGGPEEISFEDFLKRIHHIYYKKQPRTVHLPLRLLIPVISFIEKRSYSILPINVGQLSSFNNDGTIERNRLFEQYSPQMRNVDEMLKQIIKNG